jgi:diguanylate cyclase (GGDEF)-like protein
VQGWHAFISYSSRDRSKADIIVSDLEAAGLSVWYDRKAIGDGDRIRESIDVGLTLSRLLLILVSRHSLRSRWVLNELDAAMLREIERRQKFVVPILLGHLSTLDIPSDIRGKKWIDLRHNFRTRYATERSRIINLVAEAGEATLNFRAWPLPDWGNEEQRRAVGLIEETLLEEILDKARGTEFLERQLAGHIPRLRWDGATIHMLDVDGLTGINKRFGLPVGNAVLSQIARLLSAYAKPPYVGRCGDDTFYVISERWSGIEGELLNVIRRHKWKFLAPGLYVTCSIGAALLREGESALDWVVRATQGMLEAKKAGGNRAGPVPQMLAAHTSRHLRSYFS